MSALHWEQSKFVEQAQDMLARVPANTSLVTGLLAGAAAISILVVAMSAPATESAASVPSAVMTGSAPVVQASTSPTCKEQTWPYVDRSCAQQDGSRTDRPVRVISTDRGAPPTLNAAPVVLAAQVERIQPVAVAASGAVSEPTPLAGDIVANNETQEVVPMPRRRPTQVVAAQRLPSPTKLSKALTLPALPIRPEDDESVSQVRAYALSDGGRVTVYRQYGNAAERAVISRNDVYEQRPLRLPFFNLFD